MRTAVSAPIGEAAARMGGRAPVRYEPDADAHAVYDELYREYRRLHDLFGRGPDTVPKRLKAIAHGVRPYGAPSQSRTIGTNP